MTKEVAVWSNEGDAITPETLKKRFDGLGREVYGKNGGIVRQVMFQVAKVPQMKAKVLAPKDTGQLGGAIRKRRDRKPQYAGATENFVVYVYPGKDRDDKRGAWYWTFVHFANSKNPNPVPFLTMAFESTKSEQLRVFREVFKRKLKLAEKKLQKIR